MIVHRLTSRRYPLCDGEGARLYGGRWNSPGRPVVYTASTQSLAALEILAHSAALADDYIVVSISIPDALSMAEIPHAEPPDWETDTTRSIGDGWLVEGTSAILRVPSKVIPAESNYILNPAHEDFQRLIISGAEPFRFDRRLLERFLGSR